MSINTILSDEYKYTLGKFEEALRYNENHPDNTDHIYWKGRLEEVKSIMNQI